VLFRSIYSDGAAVTTRTFGIVNDIPVAADFDGDGKANMAVCRANGSLTWYIQQSSTGLTRTVVLGLATLNDKPVPADYDGDGVAEPATYRSSTGQWQILRSSSSITQSVGYGLPGDVAVAYPFNF